MVAIVEDKRELEGSFARGTLWSYKHQSMLQSAKP